MVATRKGSGDFSRRSLAGWFCFYSVSTESALLHNELLEMLCSGWNVDLRSSLV